MKNYIKLALFIIVLLSAVLRIYKLDQIPPSLNWDEAANGYNAYTIANWARDEWGQTLPLVFTSFRDDKHPVEIYITAIFVKLLGLSDFSARLSGAVIGILSVVVIFFLAKELFKSNLAAFLAALFLAVSPYHSFLSRGLMEFEFATFFFMLGLLLFYFSFRGKSWLIEISFLSFGLSLLSYHPSKIVVPPMVILLVIIYFKQLRKLSFNFYTGIFIFLVFITFLIIDPRLLGVARAQQTKFANDIIEKTQTYQKTKSLALGLGEITLKQYVTHFTPQYLFIAGDQNPRNSVKTHGQFYKIDALFLIIGLIFLLISRSKVTVVLLSWILLAPIPASLVNGAPNATRAIFMLGSLNLLAAFGAAKIINWFRGRVKFLSLAIILIVLSIESYFYFNYYFLKFPKKDAIDWQYGMKQIVEFVKANPEYQQIFVTDIRSQPYIFFLFYLKTPLPDYLNTVVYNRSESKSYSTVSYFDKYYFGGWDPIESMPNPGVLYALSPSQYDGLRHKAEFDVKKVIYYPDGGTAFYLVSTP